MYVWHSKKFKMDNFIPVNRPLLDGNEKKYLNECVDSGWISSDGPFVKKFEEACAKKFRRKYAVAITNGTAAIDIAITALNIEKDDEVIVPSFTIISCINQILRVGAKPVFVDADPHTWNMNVSLIEEKITQKTKAILVAHIYGLSVDLEPIIKIAKKNKLYLIEDAAEVHGLLYKDKPCGSFGDISTLSFYPNKHITTGEGGMVLTDNYDLFETFKKLRNIGFDEDPSKRFIHKELGWNMRMTNMQAALGLAQIEQLDKFINRKRQIGKLYTNLLSTINEITLPLEKTDYCENIYWVFGILINNPNINSVELRKYLTENNIGSRPFFFPLNQQPVLSSFNIEKTQSPNSNLLYERGLYLPSGLGNTDEEIKFVAETVKHFFGY